MADNFMNDAFNKTKEFINVAVKKTEETISVEKLKYNIYVAKNVRKDYFEQLGRIYYSSLKGTDVENEQIKGLMNSIDKKSEEIKELQDKINFVKNKRYCTACGSFVATDSSFCKNCGNKF